MLVKKLFASNIRIEFFSSLCGQAAQKGPIPACSSLQVYCFVFRARLQIQRRRPDRITIRYERGWLQQLGHGND